MALRQEVFSKVERNHLLGLRSRRPDLHGKFFKLYDGAVGNSLFHRLQYILAGQEWDAMADTFWLKQGLDLILSTLADEDHITLAPNSAQCPAAAGEPDDPRPNRPSRRRRNRAVRPPEARRPRRCWRGTPLRDEDAARSDKTSAAPRGGDSQRAHVLLPVGAHISHRVGDAQREGRCSSPSR